LALHGVDPLIRLIRIGRTVSRDRPERLLAEQGGTSPAGGQKNTSPADKSAGLAQKLERRGFFEAQSK
jgi:hypothetical protein